MCFGSCLVRGKCAATDVVKCLDPAVLRVLLRAGTVVIRNDVFACGTKRWWIAERRPFKLLVRRTTRGSKTDETGPLYRENVKERVIVYKTAKFHREFIIQTFKTQRTFWSTHDDCQTVAKCSVFEYTVV